jgi:transcription antitermination factor NusB
MSEKKYKPQLIARESAIKILYQMKMQDEKLETIMSDFIEKREYDESLFERILSEYVENKNRIISLLDKKAGVSLKNIPLLDECIIHLSVCEFLFINQSKNIVINEYINIAKKYSSPKMYTFLNRVLDNTL